jgi:cob(I)alamin adenosyltransferase
MDEMLEPLKNFILPGGTSKASAIHLCRTSARAVERRMVDFKAATGEELPTLGLEFINRLSDYFFVLARWLNMQEGQIETPWKPS